MNDQTTSLPAGNVSAIDDDAIGASVKIDWAEIMAEVEPIDTDGPLPGLVFDSADYATEEEEEAAYEAFIQRFINRHHDKT